MTKSLSLTELYAILLEEYGPQNWWPSETKLEMVFGAILVQNTAWKNVEIAISNLKRESLIDDFLSIDEETAISLIKPAGFFNQKYSYLKNFLELFDRKYNFSFEKMAQQEPDETRKVLLCVKGIGEETADSILLYALDRPCFIADAYAKRILSRIGLCEFNVKYEALKREVEDELNFDSDTYGEFHALLVQHAKTMCRKRPECGICSIQQFCKF